MAGVATCASNVTDFLLAGKEADRLALWTLAGRHTYGELESAADQVARHCVEVAGNRGARVLLVGENSFFWIAAYLGILRAGAVCVPLPASVSPQDLSYVLRTTEARVAFAQAGFVMKNVGQFRRMHLTTDREVPNLPSVASQRVFGGGDAGGGDAGGGDAGGEDAGGAGAEGTHATRPRAQVDPDDLAALMFTSGSTGRPRGVMVSHRNIMANTESIIESLGLTEEDRIMAVLPFHYCFGTSLLHTHLRAGGSLVIDSRFMYPEAVLQRMIDTECTGFAGVPSHFQILLRGSTLRKKSFPHLRYVQQAGGHLAPAFIQELREALPGTQVFIMYGQTEATARLSCLAPEFLDSKLGSIGKGIPGVRLRVLNQSGEEVRPGEVGEIVAEGENVAGGYWRDGEEPASSFRGGKLYTGDVATVDDDGFIYIVDRARDILKCGGKRVSCRQLEDQLLAFEGVVEAAVIGVPDDVLGEAVKAFVVPRAADGNGLRERLRAFCKEQMAAQLVPREIVVVKALPKNSAGKVLKPALRTL